MRYRITFEQVLNTWYATVKYAEPDGEGWWKSVGHYTIPMHDDYPTDLVIILLRLVTALGGSQE